MGWVDFVEERKVQKGVFIPRENILWDKIFVGTNASEYQTALANIQPILITKEEMEPLVYILRTCEEKLNIKEMEALFTVISKDKGEETTLQKLAYHLSVRHNSEESSKGGAEGQENKHGKFLDSILEQAIRPTGERPLSVRDTDALINSIGQIEYGVDTTTANAIYEEFHEYFDGLKDSKTAAKMLAYLLRPENINVECYGIESVQEILGEDGWFALVQMLGYECKGRLKGGGGPSHM